MIAHQLALTLMPHIPGSAPVMDEVTWLNVSDLAKGTGFETETAISIALTDALAPNTKETETDYDQRLYDALWLAHFQFMLNGMQPVTFSFSFAPVQTTYKTFEETCLRLHVECVDQTIFLGLLEDF